MLKTRAATPAATGEANDVPDHDPYPPPFIVVRMYSPGAARSIQFPKFEKEDNVSEEEVALTATTLLQPAG